MIPSTICIKNRTVRTAFETWMADVAKRNPEVAEAALEEDCCVSSPFLWTVYASGLGDVVWVQYGKHKFTAGINDDGEFFKSEQAC